MSQSFSHGWTVSSGGPQGHGRKRYHHLPSAPGNPRPFWPRNPPCQAAEPVAFLSPPPHPTPGTSASPLRPRGPTLACLWPQPGRQACSWSPAKPHPALSLSPSPARRAESSQFSSVAQSCLTLCDPMDCSTPGFPVHHQLPEFTLTHVR